MTATERTAIKKLVIAANQLRVVIKNQDLTITRNGATIRLDEYLSSINSSVDQVMAILYPLPLARLGNTLADHCSEIVNSPISIKHTR